MDKSAKKGPYSNTPRQEKAKKVKDTDTPKQQKPKNGPKKKLYTQQTDGPQILDGSESQVPKSDLFPMDGSYIRFLQLLPTGRWHDSWA